MVQSRQAVGEHSAQVAEKRGEQCSQAASDVATSSSTHPNSALLMKMITRLLTLVGPDEMLLRCLNTSGTRSERENMSDLWKMTLKKLDETGGKGAVWVPFKGVVWPGDLEAPGGDEPNQKHLAAGAPVEAAAGSNTSSWIIHALEKEGSMSAADSKNAREILQARQGPLSNLCALKHLVVTKKPSVYPCRL